MPYDELVANVVLAKGREAGVSYDDYAREILLFPFRETGDFADRRPCTTGRVAP